MSQMFWTGALGALIYEASRWIDLRYKKNLPGYMYRIHYWILTVIFIAMGGALSYFLTPETTLQALCIGIAAPSIVARLERVAPETLKLSAAERTAKDLTLREWLRS